MIPVNDNHNKEMINWSCKYLSSHGYQLTSNLPEQVQDTPWSCVVRFSTAEGFIYLKQTPELLGLEATIIQLFRDQFNAPVPKIIVHNPELNCFLMNDAGITLRVILHQQFDELLLCKAIDQFILLQSKVAAHVDVLLNIGVPDWRLVKLPGLYKDFISQKELLRADGLSEMEINDLEALLPMTFNLCEQLAEYPVQQSFVQPDFSDNNTLIDDLTQQITIIDLGEIVISHPFFSLINCLQQVKKHHLPKDGDPMYQKIVASCLKNYIKFESKKDLVNAFSIAQKLSHIYDALASYRLINACDKKKFTAPFQLQARPCIPLREYIAACVRKS